MKEVKHKNRTYVIAQQVVKKPAAFALVTEDGKNFVGLGGDFKDNLTGEEYKEATPEQYAQIAEISNFVNLKKKSRKAVKK
jgi:hypothetical protein